MRVRCFFPFSFLMTNMRVSHLRNRETKIHNNILLCLIFTNKVSNVLNVLILDIRLSSSVKSDLLSGTRQSTRMTDELYYLVAFT